MANRCTDRTDAEGCHYLRLHWQPGYDWQDQGEDTAQDWCMQYTPNNRKANVLLRQCDYGKRRAQCKQMWKINYSTGTIESCYDDLHRKCLTRTDEKYYKPEPDDMPKWIQIKDCNATPPEEQRQEFEMDTGTYEGTFDSTYYNFTTYKFTNRGWKTWKRCLTNWFHHPKRNEAFHLAKCDQLVNYKTLWWNIEREGLGHHIGEEGTTTKRSARSRSRV